MSKESGEETRKPMIKVVYFDEQSASDYLDITAGGKAETTSGEVRERTRDMHSKVETQLAAKFSWLPFVGASAQVGAGIDVASVGQSILSKTLSNTILTDYLAEVSSDSRVRVLEGLSVTAPKDSAAYVKMYTPYMIIARTEDSGLDIARMDEAFERAKGYYDLLGTDNEGHKCVLRFNIRAFRNNYGLADLRRMRLVYHGVRVGETTEADLAMRAEMSGDHDPEPTSAVDILDGDSPAAPPLDVFDVILAGVSGE